MTERLRIKSALAEMPQEIHAGLQKDLTKFSRAELLRKLCPVGKLKGGKGGAPKITKKTKARLAP